MIEYELAAEGTDIDVANNYYVFLRRDSDYTFYDTDDGVFKDFASLVAGTIPLIEDANQPGLWSLSLLIAGAADGPHMIIPRNGQTHALIIEGVARVYLVNNEPLVSLVEAQIHLHDQYTGLNAYSLLDENGAPVAGASVRVFKKTDYDANNLAGPVGTTVTDDFGRWMDPIPVNPGYTYVIAFHKHGVIGVTSVEVIVPS